MLQVLLWMVLTGAGAVLIALPDDGSRVLTFSGEHGPGPVDAVGALLLVAAFVLVLAAIYRGRSRVYERIVSDARRLAALAFGAGLGGGLLLAGVFTDFWWWWLVGAGLLQTFWLVLWRLARP